jgi:hypothetical protein
LDIAVKLGDLYKEQGRLFEAEEMYQRARQNGELIKARDTEGGDEDESHHHDEWMNGECPRSGDDGKDVVSDDGDGEDKGDDE